MKKLLLALLCVVVSCTYSFAQETHNHQQKSKNTISFKRLNVLDNNPYGLSKSQWISYYNKTNRLLEQIDEESFLHYVVMKVDGDFNDLPYFIKYNENAFVKDMQQLIYKIGVGEITSTSSVASYFTSLQPNWTNLFVEFQKNRGQIVEGTLSLRGSGPVLPPTTMGCGSACTNPGFESGTSFWNYWTGEACSNTDPCNLVAGFDPVQHTLTTAGGFDPVIGNALPVVPPGGGNHALLIGDGPITGAYAARASISFDVTAANSSFIYRYAVVLEDPVSGHNDPERPYFRVKIRDAAGNVLTCGDYEVIAKPPMAGFISAGNDIYYRPWTTVFVPLTSYIGQCVSVEFTSSDCEWGAHYGYAYVDADCGSLEITSSTGSCTSNANVIDSIIAPPGAASYAWTNVAGGTTGIVGSTTGQVATVNQSGTYQVLMTSVTGPTCITTLTISHVMGAASIPVADFEVTPNPLTGYDPLATFINKSSSDVVYWEWSFGDGTSYPNTVTPNPVHMYPKIFDATYIATLIVKNAKGCADTATRFLAVGAEFSFFIPNAFTPNHDGVNDYFFGQGVGITKYELLIYDRWGNKVFVGDHVDKKWDGKVFNESQIAQMDVFVWKVNLTDIYGKEHDYMGTVTLVR